MKCSVPEISWHNRDPILSIDFQPSYDKCRRLATCGTDAHVMVWLVIRHGNGSISLEFRADLERHSKAVNVVRFSNTGELLASGDDEANIILWKQSDKRSDDIFDDSVGNKENWVAHRVLRGHIDDICDLCWSPDDCFLASGSVDNTCIVWDVQKGKNVSILKENKGFVQGLSWDPRNVYLASLSSDRSMRIFSTQTKKPVFNVQKATISPSKGSKDVKPSRIFYDDTLKSFCRRLAFSPDGELLVAPSGIIEQEEGSITNSVYVFARGRLNEPAYYLPTGKSPSIAVRFCPLFFKLRPSKTESDAAEQDNEGGGDGKSPQSIWRLPYRMVFAVATQDALLLYDTQQAAPFGRVSNIHYTRLSDLTWSPDGQILVASSTDGFCSIITFAEGEIGEVYDGVLPHLGEEKSPTQGNDRSCAEKSFESPGAEVKSVVSPVKAEEKTNSKFLEAKEDEQGMEVDIADKEDDKPESRGKTAESPGQMAEGEPKVASEANESNASVSRKPPRRVQFVTLSKKSDK